MWIVKVVLMYGFCHKFLDPVLAIVIFLKVIMVTSAKYATTHVKHEIVEKHINSPNV